MINYTNVVKSFDMTSNSKYRTEKWVTKNTEKLKTITQKDENLVLHKNR